MNDINNEKKVRELLSRTMMGEKRRREKDREKDYNLDVLGEFVIVPRHQIRRLVHSYMWEFVYLATIGIGLAVLIYKWIN